MDEQQLRRANRILGQIPIAALIDSRIRHLNGIDDILDQLESIGTFLVREMDERQKLQDEHDRLQRDLRAAGRVLKLIQGDTAAGNTGVAHYRTASGESACDSFFRSDSLVSHEPAVTCPPCLDRIATARQARQRNRA